MRIVDFLWNITELKNGRPLDSFVEKPYGKPDRERSIKAVYDQLMEIAKSKVSLAIITHRVSSLSLLARVDADLGKFQPLLEHKSLKKTAIHDQIKDAHPGYLTQSFAKLNVVCNFIEADTTKTND